MFFLVKCINDACYLNFSKMICPICLDPTSQNHQVSMCKNNHAIHKHCLKDLIRFNPRSTCPICRQSLCRRTLDQDFFFNCTFYVAYCLTGFIFIFVLFMNFSLHTMTMFVRINIANVCVIMFRISCFLRDKFEATLVYDTDEVAWNLVCVNCLKLLVKIIHVLTLCLIFQMIIVLIYQCIATLVMLTCGYKMQNSILIPL
jgi:hypothetical protein